jgi:hypothetical protein
MNGVGLKFRSGSTSKLSTTRQRLCRGLHRRRSVEPLEDRRLLALVTVNTLADTVDFDDGLTSRCDDALRSCVAARHALAAASTHQIDRSISHCLRHDKALKDNGIRLSGGNRTPMGLFLAGLKGLEQ